MSNKEHKENKNDKQDSTTEEVRLSKEEYEALKAKAGERDAFYDKYLRAHADFENTRKRMEKEKADFAQYANESLIMEFLPIIDNLETAEKHIAEAKDFKSVREGVDMIQLQIQKFLKDIGIEKIKTVGEKFDPHLHEAVETEEAKDKEEDVIVAELKPGYKLNGKLLRPAMVRIVKNTA
ncbi:MAG: nucleotide exchange factor GrpE [Candidatus Omnitrophica bacterium]|nr:nucleotide exchange factor GrpE [Candidatus Omnitrophota bacterium]MCM8790677.1 nucleotide exchange factor GrpE [Candidatus Omnitrophota bacterium]